MSTIVNYAAVAFWSYMSLALILINLFAILVFIAVAVYLSRKNSVCSSRQIRSKKLTSAIRWHIFFLILYIVFGVILAGYAIYIYSVGSDPIIMSSWNVPLLLIIWTCFIVPLIITSICGTVAAKKKKRIAD